MDIRSKWILGVLLFTLLCSLGILFNNYIIQKDFAVIENDDGIPEILE